MTVNHNPYALFAPVFRANADRLALVDAQGAGPSFAALDDLSARFAQVLADQGVGPGDRVVAQIEKSVGAVALYLSCLRLGAIYVPLNPAYTAAEVAYFCDDAQPALFVCQPGCEHPGVASLVLGTDPASPLWARALATLPCPAIAHCEPDDIAAIIYTSGTTGRSKGAMVSHGNLCSNALALHRIWGFAPDDVLIHALPVFHVHGLFVALHTTFLNGSTTIFLPRFDPVQVIDLMPRATMLMGVPTFYTRLLAEPGFDAGRAATMRMFISGSAPLLPETHRAFAALTGQRILERYGMSEAGMITSNPLDGERVPGSVGYPLPDVELRVVDGADSPLPPGERGVIHVRGPNVFKGYWRNPQKNAEELRPDGWFVTGDIGILAADGRLEIVGRAKDLIIAGGFNIYPREIEEAIDALPGISESAVIGVPHADLGEAVVAIVTVEAGHDCDEAQVIEALATSLARFKLPRRVLVIDALPRNAMGKVQKAQLRQVHAQLFAAC